MKPLLLAILLCAHPHHHKRHHVHYAYGLRPLYINEDIVFPLPKKEKR